MTTKKWFKPFEEISKNQRLTISGIWIALVLAYWIFSSFGVKHLFPTPLQVWEGFKSLYNEGLVVHIVSSLGLCLQAAVISLVISLIVVYLSPLPVLRPLAIFLSKMRFLPLTGITYYLSILVSGARTMQVWVLVVFILVHNFVDVHEFVLLFIRSQISDLVYVGFT